MALRIQPQKNIFVHAGELESRYDSFDPRASSFLHEEVDVDLRECQFVRPAAALWCVIYLLLARKHGARCRLLVPNTMGVCLHLKSLGVFDVLKEQGVEVDDRDVNHRPDPKIILPVTHFHTTAEAASVANRAHEKLTVAPVGAANLTSTVSELFGELANNAVQHSESPIGAYACVQFVEYQNGPRFTCTVADGGIGVLASLYKNESLRSRVNYDWDALELAIRERVSGTGDPHRGIGLYGVSEDVRRPGNSLLIHSGRGSLRITESLETAARRTRLFPGTLAFLSLLS